MKCAVCEQKEAVGGFSTCDSGSCRLMYDARQTPGFNDIVEKPGNGRAALPPWLKLLRMERGAEIGVQKGEHALELLKAGVKSLILVDMWAQQEDYFDIANVSQAEQSKNLDMVRMIASKFPGQCKIIIGNSRSTADVVADGSLDFIYLDADHKYASIKADLMAWYPKVRSGGVIAGHDFMDSPNCCGSEFGVATAVKEFIAKLGFKTIKVAQGECFPNWHFIKP